MYPMNIIMELLYLICKKLATKEKVTGCFYFHTTITHGTHAVFEILTKFMFSKANKLNPEALQVIKLLLGYVSKRKVLVLEKKKFISIDLNCLKDSTYHTVLSNLFHFLTQKRKRKCLKLSVLQENSNKSFNKFICRPSLVIRSKP